MLRGYRCIIVAVAGLILIGANPAPQTSGQGKQANSTQTVSAKPQGADPASPKQEVAQRPDPGCNDRRDNRDSDLCAQWKAADAAYDAARAGESQVLIGWIGLVLGFITMGAAIAAAVYAKSAAGSARDGYHAFVNAEDAQLELKIIEAAPEIDDNTQYSLAGFITNVRRGAAWIEKMVIKDGNTVWIERFIMNGDKVAFPDIWKVKREQRPQPFEANVIFQTAVGGWRMTTFAGNIHEFSGSRNDCSAIVEDVRTTPIIYAYAEST
jgi:hypothetical protein